ncbi:MAG: OmpA family protein, partial [Pseudomonadota bacterium]
QLGVNGDAAAMYQSVVATIGENKGQRPEACARAQVMWDQYLEALRGGDKYCITPADARALLDEALAACRGTSAANFIVYFGFNRTNLTDRARATLDEVVGAVQSMGATALSLVGHADTVGSAGYNQGLSERRARRVANALVDRGIPAGAMTLAGRGEQDLARQTGDNVREPLNRRVEITLSK